MFSYLQFFCPARDFTASVLESNPKIDCNNSRPIDDIKIGIIRRLVRYLTDSKGTLMLADLFFTVRQLTGVSNYYIVRDYS